jgi:hypothetical protein
MGSVLKVYIISPKYVDILIMHKKMSITAAILGGQSPKIYIYDHYCKLQNEINLITGCISYYS